MSYLGATLAKMDAAVWTAIGLLAATSLGTLFYLGSRIDAVAARMDARFDSVDARFAQVDARFDAMLGVIETRFARVDSRFDNLETRLQSHLDRHAS